MGDKSRQLPTLAPGPRAGAPTSSAVPPSRPKKNSTACQACKQAKRKCSGRPPPCKACEAADSDCIFDESLDLRRKLAVKRTADELEFYKEFIQALLEALRSPDPARVEWILAIVRSTESIPDIASAILGTGRELQDKGTTDSEASAAVEEAAASRPSEGHSRHSFMTLDKLCDIPLFDVPARPWTNVTDDTQFVSHLVSLYFTWNHPFDQFIDQQLFLQDMASGNLDSQFCSPFLVNSLLAVASTYSDFPEAFAIPENVNTRGHHFHTEAERLWKAEEGKITLTNIQGILLLVIIENFHGNEDASWVMFSQAVDLAHGLGLFSSAWGSTMLDQKNVSGEMQHAGTICAWGISILNSQMAMTRQRVAGLKLPVFKPYMRDELEDGIVWTPYPRSNQIDYAKKPALLRYIMAEMSELTNILVEIQGLLFEKPFQDNELWRAVDLQYTRLELWYNKLPDALKIDERPVPQVLLLRMQYHWIVIMLFGIFTNRPQFPQAERAERIRLDSAQEIAKYSRVHRQSYGLNHAPSQMLHPISSSLFVLLSDLSDAESQEAFVELGRFLSALSRRIQLGKAIIRNLEHVAQQSNISLPPEAVTVLKSHDSETFHGSQTGFEECVP